MQTVNKPETAKLRAAEDLQRKAQGASQHISKETLSPVCAKLKSWRKLWQAKLPPRDFRWARVLLGTWYSTIGGSTWKIPDTSPRESSSFELMVGLEKSTHPKMNEFVP